MHTRSDRHYSISEKGREGKKERERGKSTRARNVREDDEWTPVFLSRARPSYSLLPRKETMESERNIWQSTFMPFNAFRSMCAVFLRRRARVRKNKSCLSKFTYVSTHTSFRAERDRPLDFIRLNFSCHTFLFACRCRKKTAHSRLLSFFLFFAC